MAIEHPTSRPPGTPSMMGAIGAAVLGFIIVKFVGARTSTASNIPQDSGHGAGSDRRHAARQYGQTDDKSWEDGRGRHAESPREIASYGWKDILWRTYEEFGRDRIMSVGAGVTYYALLAIFPAIAAIVSIYGLFSDPATIQEHLGALSGVLPSGALDIIAEQVTRIASQGEGTLGSSFIVGLVLALWSSNAGVKAIFDALNIVYAEEEKRGFVKLNLLSLLFTVSVIVFLLVAIAAIVVLPIVLNFVGLESSGKLFLAIGRWPMLLAGVIGGLSVLYRFGPSRDKAKWRWVTPGGIFAGVLWLAISMLFSWYVSNFGSYNETYGSLGAVIGFMTWIWISAIVVLLGAEINAEMEHKTTKDTTEGKPERLGARGAKMADTVGAKKA